MLTSKEIRGFTRRFVLENLDDPKPVPDFHMRLWDKCCSSSRQVALACPRGHGKSTAVTEIFTLASIMFKERNYVIIISDTLDQAQLFLSGIKALIENSADMQAEFGFQGWIKDGITEVIGVFEDGQQFCITAMGRGQRIRGRLWRNQRPDLVICDDIEDEKSVESDDMREGTRRWLYRAVLPALSDDGVIRIVGTILHLDSMLYRLLELQTWNTKLYKAHKSFSDFTEILWPAKFDEQRLREYQQSYVLEGIPDQYSTEYLNDPIDQSEAYFQEDDFQIMDANDALLPMEYYAAVDLAISDDDRSSYTAMVVAGLDSDGLLYILQVLRYRSNDATVHVNNMLALQQKWNIQLWCIEKGQIEQTLRGYLEKEMMDQQVSLNLEPDAVPRKEKRARARSFQGLMRSGRVRWPLHAAWYQEAKIELLQFPKGRYKDQVDAFAWLGRMISRFTPARTTEEYLAAQREDEIAQYDAESTYFGADPDTGY